MRSMVSMTLPSLLPRVAMGIAAVAALLAQAPTSASAAGSWGTVETMSRFPGPASAAIDDRGYIALVWSRGASISRRVYGTRRTPTRGFGEPFALDRTERSTGATDVRFDAERNAITAYTLRVPNGDRLVSRTIRPSGARTSARTVTDFGIPRFAAVAPGSDDAQPVLAWLTGDADGAIVGSARTTDGVFGDARFEDLPEGDERLNLSSMRFASVAGGSLLATYLQGGLFVNERPAGGSLGPAQLVSASTSTVDEHRVAVGPDGRVALAWREFVGNGGRAAFVSVRLPGGEFSAPVQVSAPGEFPVDLDVVVTSEGVVRVAYLAGEAENAPGPLRLATLGGPTETLTAEGANAEDLEIAADGRGGTTVAWQRGDPGDEAGGNAIFARAITPSGRVGKRWKLTRPGENGVYLTLAVGTDGSALVAWTASEEVFADRFRAVRRASTGG